MKHKTRMLMLASVCGLLFSGPAAAQMKAEVIHWWTSGGESAAVKVFADQFTKAGGTECVPIITRNYDAVIGNNETRVTRIRCNYRASARQGLGQRVREPF